MMHFVKNTICGALLSALMLSPTYQAPAHAGLLDKFIQHKTVPYCDDEKVINDIVKRFNWAEDRTWQRGFYLEQVNHIRERLVRDSEEQQIPRRYCRGHATLSNGKNPTTLHYLIEGGQGYAGNGFYVEFCLAGYDRWIEHNGSCRTLRY